MDLRVLRAGNIGPFTLDGTRTFIVGRRHAAVIDPGPDVEDHVRALAHALEGARRVDILVTHAHPDHAAAAAPLQAVLGGRARLRGPGGGIPLAEGDRISTDQGDLLALHTPGHAHPHFAFLHLDSGNLFCGDLLLGEGDTTWVGEYPEAVTEYLSSLRRLQGMDIHTIHPAHGPPLEDPREALGRFLEHRLVRIQQVERLRGLYPDVDPVDLASRIYGPGHPAALRAAAILSIRAILHHLGEPTSGPWGSEPGQGG